MSQKNPHLTFWIVATLGFIWNLTGCLNYVAQSNAETVAMMPEAYQFIIDGRPAWATAAFAIGVFGGAVGCILLLLRRQVAIHVFVISLMGIIGTSLFTGMLVGVIPSLMLSMLIGLGLLWYATIARRAGWLR